MTKYNDQDKDKDNKVSFLRNRDSDEAKEQAKPETAPTLVLNTIFVKEFSFKAPHSPEIFNERWKPRVDFKLQLEGRPVFKEKGIYEVILEVTILLKNGEENSEKDAFTIHLKQGGVFTVQNLIDDQLKQVLNITCPSLLYPHLRETISSFITRGGFPQIMLPPIIGFDTIYKERLKKEEKGKSV